MRGSATPDAGLLILSELGQWTGEERTQYVNALRELSVQAAVRVTVVPPADPLAGADTLAGAPFVAAFGAAERTLDALWRPERASDMALRAALAHAAAEIGRMREVLLSRGG
jgi:hypothetical protein